MRAPLLRISSCVCFPKTDHVQRSQPPELAAGSTEDFAVADERGPGIGPGPCSDSPYAGGPARARQSGQGVNLLMRVDQLPSAVRTPVPLGGLAQVPSRLSPLPPAKNGPPQVV